MEHPLALASSPRACRNMIRMCRKEGTNNPDLWAQVLTHLVNKVPPARAGDGQKLPPGDADRGVAMERGVSRRGRRGAGDYDETNSSGDEMDEELDRKEAWDDVQELLALINRDAVLPPLQVRQVFFFSCRNPCLGCGEKVYAAAVSPRRKLTWGVCSWSALRVHGGNKMDLLVGYTLTVERLFFLMIWNAVYSDPIKSGTTRS